MKNLPKIITQKDYGFHNKRQSSSHATLSFVISLAIRISTSSTAGGPPSPQGEGYCIFNFSSQMSSTEISAGDTPEILAA